MSSANENNFTGNWGFVHIYDRILSENNSLFVQGLPNKLKTHFLYLFLVEILPSKIVRFHRFVLSFDPGIFHLSTCVSNCTKTEVSLKYYFSKCDQIRSFLRIWSHLLKKSLMKNFIFCAMSRGKKC